jgi:hypothetical protein
MTWQFWLMYVVSSEKRGGGIVAANHGGPSD